MTGPFAFGVCFCVFPCRRCFKHNGFVRAKEQAMGLFLPYCPQSGKSGRPARSAGLGPKRSAFAKWKRRRKSGASFIWQGQKDSNPRHAVLETAALPAELYPYVLSTSLLYKKTRRKSSPWRRISPCFFLYHFLKKSVDILPFVGYNKTRRQSRCGPVVQLVRTLACHARGREFEPHPGRHLLL